MIVLLLERDLFILLMIKSIGSKNISFNSFKSNILQNSILASEFLLRGVHIVNYTGKLFSYQAKNVKNGKNDLKSWRIHLNIYFLLVE